MKSIQEQAFEILSGNGATVAERHDDVVARALSAHASPPLMAWKDASEASMYGYIARGFVGRQDADGAYTNARLAAHHGRLAQVIMGGDARAVEDQS